MGRRESLHKLAFSEMLQSNFGFENKKSNLSMILPLFLVSGDLRASMILLLNLILIELN